MAFECPLMICDVGVDVFCFVFNSGELKKTPSKKEAPERIVLFFFAGSGLGKFSRSVFYCWKS